MILIFFLGELFSPSVKELAASQAAMFNWTLSFVVTFIFTPLQVSTVPPFKWYE